jgi:site-specific recombinase XerC
MTRGRRRKHDPRIPAHIDQGKLPRGVYWNPKGAGRWYVIERGDKPTKKTVATHEARLSDLHAIMEARSGVDRSTLSWLLDEFHKSPVLAAKAAATRKGYEFYRGVVKSLPIKAGKLGDLRVAMLSPAVLQKVVDKIAGEGTPTKANALLRYLRRVFSWAVRRDLCKTNPAKGVEQAKERKAHRMPEHETVDAVVSFCKLRGARKAHTAGSVAPYLWIVIELAYLCRLRGFETLILSDASAKQDGLLVTRGKGSLPSLVEWTPRLRAAWDAAIELRRDTLARLPKDKRAVVPIDPAKRFAIVSQDGGALRKSSLDTAWQRMIHMAMDGGVISADRRFSLHGMKHRGVTDTAGTPAEKQAASGHKTAAMVRHYDHSVPRVKPAGDG